MTRALSFEDARETIQQLAIDYNTGRIGLDLYTDGVRDVLSRFERGITPRAVEVAAPLTPAYGFPSDPAYQFTPQYGMGLMNGDPPYCRNVQGHDS